MSTDTAAAFGFSVNSKEIGGFDPLPKGDYEMVVTEVKIRQGETAFSSGNTGLDVTLTVRNDVEQEGAKRKVFDTLVALPSVMFKFQQYSVAVGLEEGTKIESLEAFAKAIMYKPVTATLGIDSYVKDGDKVFKNDVKAIKPAKTGYAGGAPTGGDPFSDDGKPIDISDDDLPF